MLNKVLDSCYYVYNNSKFVSINKEKIKDLINDSIFHNKEHWLEFNPFGLLDLNIEDLVNFLIIFGSIDFSFWGNPKWTIKGPNTDLDGAMALIYALLMLREKKGHLNFLEISINEFKDSFKGNVDIPLLEERYKIVYDISKAINEKMNGNFYNFIRNVNNDEELFNIIINNFPSFKDSSIYKEQEIYFYKLAQLVTSDILAMKRIKENINVDNTHLVGCADYKIPQILRGLGILEYSEELSNLVDNKMIIEKNSVYEIEIRALMIVSIDLIYKELKGRVDKIVINDVLWSLGQDKSRKYLPYHLTRTTAY